MYAPSNSPSSTRCSDSDNWYGVEDARRRKQIQDRLAQRARRKRLQESKTKTALIAGGSIKQYTPRLLPRAQATAVESKATTPGNDVNLICVDDGPVIFRDNKSRLPADSEKTLILRNQDAVRQRCKYEAALVEHGDLMFLHSAGRGTRIFSPTSSSPTRASDSSSAMVLTARTPTSELGFDHHYLPAPDMSIYSALYENGRILGLVCGHHVPSRSTPGTSVIPLPLHPTPLQMSTVHSRFIDQLPFPRLRDSLISLSFFYNEQDFLIDLLCSGSFMVKPGCASWDPLAWRVSNGFKSKWAFLFY